MEQLNLSRRDILKGVAAAGGLGVAGAMLGPLAALADDLAAGDESSLFGAWVGAIPIAELASTFNDFHPSISKGGRSLYFTTDRTAPPRTEIWVSQRDDLDSPWGIPAPVSPLNAGGSGVPNLTPSGHFIYFNTNRPGGAGSGDVWVSFRRDRHDDFGWGPPVPVPGQLNTPAAESGPTFYKDAEGIAHLYFTRFSGNGVFGQPDQDFDIYVSAENADGTFGAGQIVTPLNAVPQPGDPPHTWSRDTRTAIRRDGLEMYITSNRHFGRSYSGGPIENLWVSARPDTSTENWSVPVLVDGVNSGYGDGGPALSRDGTTLYFFSQRATVLGKPGKRQLWMATRERR